MTKCIVYNMEHGNNPKIGKEFYVCANGIPYTGKCEQEVDLPDDAIAILKNAVITRHIIENGVRKEEKFSRYRVVVVEPKKEKAKAEPASPPPPPINPKSHKADEK